MLSWFKKLTRPVPKLTGSEEATTVDIHGIPLECRVCSNEFFYRRDLQLNTRTASFLGVEWMNQDATCAVCDNCGYIHWFHQVPPRS